MFKFLVAVAIALVLTACGNNASPGDPFVGTYGNKVDNAIEPFLKIEKDSGRYVAYEHAKDGSWQKINGEIKAMTAEELSDVVGQKEAEDAVGIKAQTFAFLHTPVGWSAHGFVTKTGFVVLVPFRLLDVQRM